jgi:hypothetical protein
MMSAVQLPFVTLRSRWSLLDLCRLQPSASLQRLRSTSSSPVSSRLRSAFLQVGLRTKANSALNSTASSRRCHPERSEGSASTTPMILLPFRRAWMSATAAQPQGRQPSATQADVRPLYCHPECSEGSSDRRGRQPIRRSPCVEVRPADLALSARLLALPARGRPKLRSPARSKKEAWLLRCAGSRALTKCARAAL